MPSHQRSSLTTLLDFLKLLAAMIFVHRPSSIVHRSRITSFLFALGLWSVVCGLWPSSCHAQTVRVAVLQNIPKFSLSVDGSYQIFPLYSAELLTEGRSLQEVSVTGTPAGIQLGDQELAVFGIMIRAQNQQGSLMTLNGRHFRGGMDIYRQQDQTLLVVNHVDVEDYIKGVLYHEVSDRWPPEVLKAQAIASRSYVLYQMTVSGKRDFDVTSDVFSQVYGGATSEKSRTSRAADQTRGEILIWRGEIFPAYFHSTCGGHTLASRELWNIDIPPLSGVFCPHCARSPHYSWERTVSKQRILSRLRKTGYPALKDIAAIKVTRADPEGRPLDLVISHPGGEFQIGANAFRLTMGPNEIRSTFFRVEVQGGELFFQGRGWGHGVGMCQWGAYGMARQEKKMEEILAQYYPGAEIVMIQ